nr:hypothetical protein [Tanacetum cinerariifolium]
MEILLEPTSYKLMISLTKAENLVKKILLKLNLSDQRSILTDLQVIPTKLGRMTKPYSSHRFIANCFNAGNFKMEVKVPGSAVPQFITICSYPTINTLYFKTSTTLVNQERYEHVGPMSIKHKVDKFTGCPKSSEDEVADDAGKKREAANTTNTNRLNTVSSPVNANGNRMFTPVSAARSTYVNLDGLILFNVATLPNADLPTDHLMPDLEDTADLQDSRIFSGAYNDEVEGAVADFNNLELM